MDTFLYGQLYMVATILVAFNPQAVFIQTDLCTNQLIQHRVLLDGHIFIWRVVYGSNFNIERKVLWKSLKVLEKGICIPWLIQGDFSATLSIQGVGGIEDEGSSTQEFQECVSNVNLVDLKAKEGFYT